MMIQDFELRKKAAVEELKSIQMEDFKVTHQIRERKREIEEEIKNIETKLKGEAWSTYSLIGTFFYPIFGGSTSEKLSDIDKESLIDKLDELREKEHFVIVNLLKRSKKRMMEKAKLKIQYIESRMKENRLKIASISKLEKLFSMDKRLYLLDTDHLRLIDRMINDCLKSQINEKDLIKLKREEVNKLDKQLIELSSIDVNKINFERAKLRKQLIEIKKKCDEEIIRKEERIQRIKMKLEQDQIEKRS
jgi:hypothetical protein